MIYHLPNGNFLEGMAIAQANKLPNFFCIQQLLSGIKMAGNQYRPTLK
jgi:TPP-dependent pyruvate/acetoin dehydrogenase alpha subunit